MSNFIKIGNTILKNVKKNKNDFNSRSNSVFNQTFKPNNLKKSSSVPYFSKNNTKYNNNEKQNYLPKIKNSTTNLNFYNKNQNNYKKFNDLRNTVQFHSFNKKDYILKPIK